MKTIKHFIFAGIVGSSGLASANAFNINEHDARATGRGGATAASNTTPSAIVFNVGGLGKVEGTSVLLGTSFYFAQGSYQASGEDKVETDSDPSVVPSFYLASRVHDKFAVGIGFHLPFGLAVSWPTGHAQADVIQDQQLRTYFITPSVGINVSKELSIGAGVDLVPATVELENAVRFGDATGNAHLGGEAFGVGGRVGAMYHRNALKVGVMWRSNVNLDFEGSGDFDIGNPYRERLPPDGDIATSITLPQSIWGGIGYAASSQLELEYNAVWINWKKFDSLTITLPDQGDMVLTASPQNYENTVTHRLGLDYSLPSAKANLRLGFIFDPTPIPASTLSARLPDVDRKIITAGASKYFGSVGAHLGLLWVTPDERDTSTDNPYEPQFKARYGIEALVASIAISGTFGAAPKVDVNANASAEATISKR